jgi:ubiquinone/menaquinone biosynthesis C-methylase UbiE
VSDTNESAAQAAWGGQSFGSVADIYDASRPSYPVEAAQFLLGELSVTTNTSESVPRRTVVDVGAGTGKLTGVLRSLGHHVIAVDPDPDMLAALSKNFPDVETHVGTAESLPIPDGFADAIVIAQAFHWVHRDTAFPELARILKPGGSLGIVWNHRDDSEPWVGELAKLWQEKAVTVGATFDHLVGEHSLFTKPEVHVSDYNQSLTTEQLIALTGSRSYVIALSQDERNDLFEKIRVLTNTHKDLAGRTEFNMAYHTRAYRLIKL